MFSLSSIQKSNNITQTHSSSSLLFNHHHHHGLFHHSIVSTRPRHHLFSSFRAQNNDVTVTNNNNASNLSRNNNLTILQEISRSSSFLKIEENTSSYSLSNSNKLKIAIIGFGNFGQFIAKAFIQQGHIVLAHSRTDYSLIAKSLNVNFFKDPHDICEQHPDIVVLCTSINSLERVIRSLPIQKLKRNTLFVDVLSVKEFPKNIFLQLLPQEFDILCTHPMFGPTSGKDNWKGLPFMFDKVRIGQEESRIQRVNNFINIFEKEGCRMVEMSCSEHDKYAAGSQFITHTIGRVLQKLGPETTPINTKGYEKLLNLMENTTADSFDLYYGLFAYNSNSMEVLERLDMALESVKMELFGKVLEKLEKRVEMESRLALPTSITKKIENLQVEMKKEAIS
ncbi:PREDICTED: arogenate dehydrogenase 2, chloroplastic-like [Nicotiana attenuata]|uniref:Arogenate dehydrogenase 2, chloroplastic n=1 Tax=Nicotiana attenuata TaxID=49451 RepID=A0A314L6K0_NICAT|nr:PREDICTED: arogenate dehydrogenase 2, chloroplastic-like [Nicotiana attenuata]OIT37193.1 arogenate dehydrogenase 2, chloroplastic [Nicotiana attenuata]